MPILFLQFPHVLVRCLHVVITDLLQYLLQKRLLNVNITFLKVINRISHRTH